MGEVPLTETYEFVSFGKEMRKQFMFSPEWRNFNQGSFGACPRSIHQKQRQYQDECELYPDVFIRYTYPRLLDRSRQALAQLLNVPPSTIVLVQNATTATNVVLCNLVWNQKDEIIYFNTIYGSCEKTVQSVSEVHHGAVLPRKILVRYPIEDPDLLNSFKDAIKASRAQGKNPRVAIFDTVSSLPGLRMPFESLASICREEGILSLVDGAHGVGHIPLDLSALDPDFFFSNCHKWLFIPRGCCVLYVPERHQALIRSTVPTSHGFIPRDGIAAESPLPQGINSPFVNNFEFVGTIDSTNYLCVPDALKWREEVCGGEKAIMSYTNNLARAGGKVIANILGTEVLDNNTSTLTNCGVVNVLLPLTVGLSESPGKHKVKAGDEAMKAYLWMLKTLMEEYKTFIPVALLYDQWQANHDGVDVRPTLYFNELSDLLTRTLLTVTALIQNRQCDAIRRKPIPQGPQFPDAPWVLNEMSLSQGGIDTTFRDQPSMPTPFRGPSAVQTFENRRDYWKPVRRVNETSGKTDTGKASLRDSLNGKLDMWEGKLSRARSMSKDRLSRGRSVSKNGLSRAGGSLRRGLSLRSFSVSHKNWGEKEPHQEEVEPA